MRCNNCGWDNPEGKEKCVKCNSVLTDTAATKKSTIEPAPQQSDLKGTIKGGNADAEPLDKQKVAGTIKGGVPDANPWDRGEKNDRSAEPAKTQAIINCTNCGYPVSHGADKCPKCGTVVDRQIVEEPVAKTINPYSKSKTSICYLNLLPRENEKEGKRIELDGNSIDLSRANVEPENESLSRHVHAHLEFRDGNWYISNPDDKVTFKKIIAETKISSGDIFLLGDRMIQFEGN